MGLGHKEEEFFLKSMNVERVFEIIERTDYFFLYNIKLCIEASEIEQGVYLSELAEEMNIPVIAVSKEIQRLEEGGYVEWKLDEKKEKTYIVLTNKAVELGQLQKRKFIEAYEKITNNISEEDMKITLLTLSRIRELMENN